MKNLLKELKFTKKSLIPVGIILITTIYIIMVQVDFSNQSSVIISSVFSVLIGVFYISYIIVVFCSYYCLPKNKSNKIGVLFVIDAKIHDDYEAIKDKLIGNFNDISSRSAVNILKPIVLSEKVVSTKKLKNIIYDKEGIVELLKKSRCNFIILIKTTDTGRNSDTYELSMNATILHSKFDLPIKKIFENNVSYIFKTLRNDILNRKDELQNLKVKSSKLYVVCQLIFATACEYSGNVFSALPIFKELYSQLVNNKDDFYNLVKHIVKLEIFTCFIIVDTREYKNYIKNGSYKVEDVEKATYYIEPLIKSLDSNYQKGYHNSLAIRYVLTDDILAAKKEAEFLKIDSKQTSLCKRWWEYSLAFILACENNPAKYNQVISKYEKIKNVEVDCNDILRFIKRYLNVHSDLIGVKVALFCLYYYRKELDIAELPTEFIQNLIDDLKDKGCISTSDIIMSMVKKRLDSKMNNKTTFI